MPTACGTVCSAVQHSAARFAAAQCSVQYSGLLSNTVSRVTSRLFMFWIINIGLSCHVHMHMYVAMCTCTCMCVLCCVYTRVLRLQHLRGGCIDTMCMYMCVLCPCRTSTACSTCSGPSSSSARPATSSSLLWAGPCSSQVDVLWACVCVGGGVNLHRLAKSGTSTTNNRGHACCVYGAAGGGGGC
jgi:hypothetical protein